MWLASQLLPLPCYCTDNSHLIQALSVNMRGLLLLCSLTLVGIALQEYLPSFLMLSECLQISGEDDLE